MLPSNLQAATNRANMKPIDKLQHNNSMLSTGIGRTATLPRRLKEKFLNKHQNTSTNVLIDGNVANEKSVGTNLTPSIYSTTSVNSQSSSLSNSSSCSASSAESFEKRNDNTNATISNSKIAKLKEVSFKF
jgi:hypothetical protein